ncbi:hypothetical protein GOP47_0016335 [Adiantum capillus-veneris]|uniref:Peptidoglycan binding-like domain-containing protein n=1 Tax=Adiantum capillus-veneris TaxID=13818 RepID=A0A9D4ZBZ0_ADICA|nr:hypothetical protein GOP47_0016335 [Adiantum capillus-veneris]
MLCHGGLILLRSPGQIAGYSENEIEKPFKELETRLSHCRQVPRSQLFDFKPDKFKRESVLKPTNLPYKGKPLGREEAKLKSPEASSASNGEYIEDEVSKKSKKTLVSDASCKQDVFGLSGSDRFSEMQLPYARDSNGEDWRSLSRALASGPKVSAISNRDLMRIAELRFSNDMNEGDSGSQVVLLQKALFWLGYLSKQSHITGYFGIETKQALREFQEAHGVGQTGLWGPLSKQALWHSVSAEILHRAVDEKSSKSAAVQNCDSRSKSDIFAQVCQSWTPMKLADVFKAAMPEGDSRLVSGIAFLVVGILFGLLISRVSSLPAQNNLVKRKIVRFNDLEKHNSQSSDEKKVSTSPSTNGASIESNISQLTSRKPAYTTDTNALGEADALGVHEKKLFPRWRHISSLGHGVQNGTPKPYGVSKKDVYAPAPFQKTRNSKLGTESMRGKQPGQCSRSIRQSGSVSRMREDSKPTAPSSIARETAGLCEDNESMFPSKNSFAGQRDELQGGSMRFDNDFRLVKDDGAAAVTQGEEEPSVRKRIEELRKAVEAAEQNGQAAVLALAEERERSRELEGKISRQRESAAALEAEVRVLKESHDALLESLRKKIGPATRGASLLYQKFKNDGSTGLS